MLKRLNTEQQLAPYVTQFVPLKVDVASPEYQRLQRKHQSEGNTIPKIFVIRADGKKLYAKSGSLTGDQLPTLMVAAVREMGRPLDAKESELLKEINASIATSIQENDFRSAATEFRKVKRLGEFGQIQSYARAAIENNQLAKSLIALVKEKVSEIQAAMESPDGSIFSKMVLAIELKGAVGTLPLLRLEINQLDKVIRTGEKTNELYPIAKKVSAAATKLNHKSSRVVDAARRTLRELESNATDSQVKTYLNEILKLEPAEPAIEKTIPTNKESKPDMTNQKMVRMWTSSDGKFSIEASFVRKNGETIALKKTNDQVIMVPLSRLSEMDREFIAKIK